MRDAGEPAPSVDSYDNRQGDIPSLKTPVIETFKNVYPKKRFTVHLEIPEFTAMCPKTGLPDFGIVFLEYQPSICCIELKSLKNYFLFYRTVGIFHENVANKVLDDICQACTPHYAKIKVEYNLRGGIRTIVVREYPSNI